MKEFPRLLSGVLHDSIKKITRGAQRQEHLDQAIGPK